MTLQCVFALDDKSVYTEELNSFDNEWISEAMMPALTMELRQQIVQRTSFGLLCGGVSCADSDRGCEMQRSHSICWVFVSEGVEVSI